MPANRVPSRPQPVRRRVRDSVARGVSMSVADDEALARIVRAKYPAGAGMTQVVRDLIWAEVARLDRA